MAGCHLAGQEESASGAPRRARTGAGRMGTVLAGQPRLSHIRAHSSAGSHAWRAASCAELGVLPWLGRQVSWHTWTTPASTSGGGKFHECAEHGGRMRGDTRGTCGARWCFTRRLQCGRDGHRPRLPTDEDPFVSTHTRSEGQRQDHTPALLQRNWRREAKADHHGQASPTTLLREPAELEPIRAQLSRPLFLAIGCIHDLPSIQCVAITTSGRAHSTRPHHIQTQHMCHTGRQTRRGTLWYMLTLTNSTRLR